MRNKLLIAAILLGSPAWAQLLDKPVGDEPVVESQESTVRFQVGAVVTAKRGACLDIRAMVAVPIDTPEQSVRLVQEDFTPNVAGVDYRELAGGNVKQMLVSIPRLESGAEARAVLTFEITMRTTPPPADSQIENYLVPKRTPRGLRGYLGPSPFIESKHPQIRRLARKIRETVEREEGEDVSDWRLLEALYDHVLDNIEYIEGPDTSALTTLQDASADCHGRSALFIALCRASGVPARMVWVNEHCYPEFYMNNPEGEGVWLPAESAGTRAFGEMPIARPILQKGDDFRVPERPRDRLRYASDYLTGRPAPGGGKPSVKYLREIVP